jgi:hypothetical protein
MCHAFFAETLKLLQASTRTCNVLRVCDTATQPCHYSSLYIALIANAVAGSNRSSKEADPGLVALNCGCGAVL